MKSNKMLLIAFLIIGLLISYFVFRPGGTFEKEPQPFFSDRSVPSASVLVCPYYYQSFEHKYIAYLIQIGNITRNLNIRDQYSRPTPGVVWISGKREATYQQVHDLAEPYLSGGCIDTIVSIQRVKEECYYKKLEEIPER